MSGPGLVLAEASVRKFVGLEPLFPLTEVWHWLLVGAGLLVVAAYIVLMYLRDGVELPAAITVLLASLRLAALLGLVVFLLHPVLRSERTLVKHSRVSLLVDTSLSMGLRDEQDPSGGSASSRIERVVQELARGQLLQRLRREHDVIVYRFDQQAKPIQVASLPKLAAERTVAELTAAPGAARQAALRQSRWIALVAAGLLVLALLLGVACVLARSALPVRPAAPWLLLASVLSVLGGAVLLAIADLRSSDLPFAAVVGLATPQAPQAEATPAKQPEAEQEVDVDWAKTLVAGGTETRLGDAIRYLVNKERGGPVAGLVVLTDGQSNEGVDCSVAAAAAADAGIPLYTIGLGSDARPVNVRVVDLQAPRRVYPGDKFAITALVQSYGLRNRRVKLRLVSTREDDPDQIERFEDERTVQLGQDGVELAERFEIEPEKDEGRRIYRLRIEPPPGDRDAKDNEMTATVEVVERKNRVLLIAGGPTRDFRFLRSQLYRDDETELWVWLQSGQPGMAYAEGRETLIFDFPTNEDELFQLDCIVAFDPDWRMLSQEQVDLLERWISEKAGGMIVVAGPVYTPSWTARPRGDARIDTLRALYPVSFFNQGSATIKVGRFGGQKAWPIRFTRAGRSAEFLWLEDTADKSLAAWDRFEGVYGYYAVNEPKPGATVYGRFSDPATAGGPDDELPIYMAGQFYGAGRVFFQASGEMWRLRAVDVKYFETYYTKLIRWVSQGRLLRDSLHGVLLVDKDRCLVGDQVEVRAMLTDVRHLPLAAEEVTAAVIGPSGGRRMLVLRRVRDGARQGTFAGRFTAEAEGLYHIALAVPGSDTGELLTGEVRVRMPDKEIQRPQRNDPLLVELARRTGGVYFVGLQAALGGTAGGQPLYQVIAPQDQVSYLPGTPDRDFTTKLMGWLLGLICGTLALEWLIRRLSKLA